MPDMDMGGWREGVVVKLEGEGNNMSEPTYQTSSAATAIVKVRVTLLRQELRTNKVLWCQRGEWSIVTQIANDSSSI